jgi:flagellar rod assembly protein/muramidase FlgJ
MDARISNPALSTPDVYTDVQGLQSLKTEKDENVALKKIAQQFESLFLHEMLKTMRKANESFEKDSLFNGGDTGFFRDMYDQQLSLSLAQKGTGLAKVIYEQLSRQYGSASENTEDSTAPALTLPNRGAPSTAYRKAVQPEVQEPAERSSASAAEATPSVFASAGEFVDAILPHARAAASMLGVNPLFLAAQAALETGWGKYVVRDQAGQSTHNLFNIKADRSWQGDKAEVSTLEYRGGVPMREQAQFRKYHDIGESFADYVRFLQNNPRYQDALAVAEDERQFAVGLQNAGYATDPAYADKILTIVEQLSARQLGSR